MNRLDRACLLAPLLVLSACGTDGQADEREPIEAASLTVVADISRSTAIIGNAGYQDDLAELIATRTRERVLGDEVRLILAGDRSATRTLSKRIRTSRKLRLDDASELVREEFRTMVSEVGEAGDGSTNVLWALEGAGIDCSDRSKLLIATDGLEANEDVDLERIVKAGGKLELPDAARPYLAGCSVEVVGLGIMEGDGPDQKLVPLVPSLQRELEFAWTDYLVSAGVKEDQIKFSRL